MLLNFSFSIRTGESQRNKKGISKKDQDPRAHMGFDAIFILIRRSPNDDNLFHLSPGGSRSPEDGPIINSTTYSL
jgi:hypothetical protein